MAQIPGLIKGLGVTFGEMVKTLKPDSRGGGPVTTRGGDDEPCDDEPCGGDERSGGSRERWWQFR